MLMVRMILDVYYAIKEQGCVAVLIHAMKGNNTHTLLNKYGFVTLLERSTFLKEPQQVCFMQLPYLNTLDA